MAGMSWFTRLCPTNSTRTRGSGAAGTKPSMRWLRLGASGMTQSL